MSGLEPITKPSLMWKPTGSVAALFKAARAQAMEKLEKRRLEQIEADKIGALPEIPTPPVAVALFPTATGKALNVVAVVDLPSVPTENAISPPATPTPGRTVITIDDSDVEAIVPSAPRKRNPYRRLLPVLSENDPLRKVEVIVGHHRARSSGGQHRVHVVAAVGRLGRVTFRLDKVDRAIQNAPKGIYKRGRPRSRDIVFGNQYKGMEGAERMDAILEDLKIKAKELGEREASKNIPGSYA